jgi:hypothetical protein
LDASGFGYSNSFLITYRYWLDYYLPALGYLSIYSSAGSAVGLASGQLLVAGASADIPRILPEA